MARAPGDGRGYPGTRTHDCAVTWAYLERVTRIELALSAGESVPLTRQVGLSSAGRHEDRSVPVPDHGEAPDSRLPRGDPVAAPVTYLARGAS